VISIGGVAGAAKASSVSPKGVHNLLQRPVLPGLLVELGHLIERFIDGLLSVRGRRL